MVIVSYWVKTYNWVAVHDATMYKGDVLIAGGDVIGGCITRLTTKGEVKWQKSYRGSNFYSLAVAPKGDIIVSGSIRDSNDNYTVGVLRLDEEGNVKWAKTYGLGEAKAVVMGRNGDVIVAGYVEKKDKKDAFVARLDGDGKVKWFKTYGGEKDDGFNDVKIAPNGDVIVAGYTRSFGAGGRDAWVLRLDKEGNVKWQKTYGGSYLDEANAVAIAPNGDVIVAGSTRSFGPGLGDVWVLRLDADGNVKWQKTYGGSDNEWANAIAIADNGDIIVAGGTYSFGAGDRDAWVLRLDENGNVKWQKTYGGSRNDEAASVLLDEGGNIIIAGNTASFGSKWWDIWVLRLPPDGDLEGFSRDSNAIVMESNAKVADSDVTVTASGIEKEIEVEEETFKEETIYEEKEVWETVGLLRKKKVKKTVKVPKTIRVPKKVKVKKKVFEPIEGVPVKTSIVEGSTKIRVQYDSEVEELTNFWRAIGRREYQKVWDYLTRARKKLGEEFDTTLIDFIIDFSVLISKGDEKKNEADVFIVASNRGIPDVDIKVKPENDRHFSSPANEIPLKLKAGESIVKVIRAQKKSDLGWGWFDVVFELPAIDYKTKVDARLVSSGELGELYLTLASKTRDYKEKLRFLNQAIKEGSKEAKEEAKKVLVNVIPGELSTSVPRFIEDLESTVKLTLTNNLADSLKATLDLSGNDFFELEEENLEFPELKRGQKVSKSITVKPKYAGKFDFRIKIKAIVNGLEIEAEKVIPVEVEEKAIAPPVQPSTPAAPAYTPAQFTPSPTTPKTFPLELAELYTDVDFIGKGGFARVFKAKRKRDGKVVAIKIPISLDPATGKSFLREIENWTKLKHPNIVRVYDYNILPVPFFEMEYCEDSLENLLRRRGYLPPMEAARIVFDIAEGLKYAHSKRVIHRDLKPSNILLKSGIPKISDWGLSKVLKESRSSTFASFTPYYAAPEQISKSKFGSTDERTDIWQLGVIFYQLVTGKLPFEGEDFVEVSSSIVYETPERPSELNPDAEPLDDIIMRCLAKRREERYESTAELQGELALFLGMEYRRSLKKSVGDRDLSRSAYYTGELLLVNLKIGDLAGAYKYAGDLAHYASGEVIEEIKALKDQIKARLEEGLDIPPELVEKADVIVHKVKLGWREV
ncbi:protein kinase [Thermococcus sp.]|uniref:protein kinase domain-containing protein n=1 Tax=Thermococcus sp. TaxID=35749 RepID=UPI00345D2A04